MNEERFTTAVETLDDEKIRVAARELLVILKVINSGGAEMSDYAAACTAIENLDAALGITALTTVRLRQELRKRGFNREKQGVRKT